MLAVQRRELRFGAPSGSGAATPRISSGGILPRRLARIERGFILGSGRHCYFLSHARVDASWRKIESVPPMRGEIAALCVIPNGEPRTQKCPDAWLLGVTDEFGFLVLAWIRAEELQLDPSTASDVDIYARNVEIVCCNPSSFGRLVETHSPSFVSLHGNATACSETRAVVANRAAGCVSITDGSAQIIRVLFPLALPSGDAQFVNHGSGSNVLVVLEGAAWSQWDLRVAERKGMVSREAPNGFGTFGCALYAVDSSGTDGHRIMVGGEQREALLYDSRNTRGVLSRWASCVQHDITWLRQISRGPCDSASSTPDVVLVAGAHNELALGAWDVQNAARLRQDIAANIENEGQKLQDRLDPSDSGADPANRKAFNLSWSLGGAQAMQSGSLVLNDNRVLTKRTDERIVGLTCQQVKDSTVLDHQLSVLTHSNVMYELQC
ncbi:hypothetical protein FVE85_3702 [Porphyridium purpureum]|uniref:Uncharacterized protein n=1 Tax=Porphyridium purpureum TaxID=35688 RepID=A0A5J4YNL1_PORPP|nr:hypothetical protein FVE85_3702 [Porphyridium purpureum]|eukprot:POR6448..scf249_10